MSKPLCAAVDWGTSAFRLWILSEDGSVLAKRRSDEGMIKAAATGFDRILETHLGKAGADAELPVIICGMAGARQGWREVRYMDIPAELTAIGRNALTIEGYPRDVRILPGLARRDPNRPDIMRGEETLLLGALAQGLRCGLICLPGTHSKWVQLRAGRADRFSTYMTGELFSVLSKHSILSSSVGDSAIAPDDPAFLDAVHCALEAPRSISNRLFSIRAGHMLGSMPQADNAARLSGLLMGLEFAAAWACYGPVETVTLIASGDLGELYRSMLETNDVGVDLLDAEEMARRGLLEVARSFWMPDMARH